MEPMVYRIADAAKVIGLSRSRIYELIDEGALEARKIGRCTVIPLRVCGRW
jgi:excisionase family DNA binding protein